MPLNKNLKIAAIALDITWADPEENRYNVAQALNSLDNDIDLVVLPEMFTSGFITHLDRVNEIAEDWNNSPTLNFLKSKAAKHKLAICASFLVRDGGEKALNRCVFVEPSGELTIYDKHHLFSLGDESNILERGILPMPIVRFRGWNFAMAICYDVRFPVWTRNIGNKYDILLIPANWPQSRGYIWEHLLIGRAIENQAYVVGVNRSGYDDFGKYDNMTYIFDYVGQSIGDELNANKIELRNATKIVVAEFSHEKLNKLRHHFPVINDADKFKIL